MGKSYSEDMRKRVIGNYVKGMSRKEIVEILKIGIATLNRWIKSFEETGSLKPKVRTVYRARKFSDEELIKYVREHTSATLLEMANHFGVRAQSVSTRCRLLGIKYKKKSSSTKKGMRKRELFL